MATITAPDPSPPRNPDGTERRSLGEKRREILVDLKRRTVFQRAKLDQLELEQEKMVVREIETGIQKRLLKTLNGEGKKRERFSGEVKNMVSEDIDSYMTRGIVPVVMKKKDGKYIGNPFGEAFAGHDRLRDKLEGKTRNTWKKENPEGEDELHMITVPGSRFTTFVEPAKVENIQAAAENDELGFDIQNLGSHMCISNYVGKLDTSGNFIPGSGQWETPQTIPIAEEGSHPNAQFKHYGSALFEGIAVERGKDGKVYIFRLRDHYERLCKTAKSQSMEPPPWEMFEQMAIQMVQANAQYIPAYGQGRLYLRPNEFDAEKKVKVGTSGVYELCWTAIAIGTTQGAYFKSKSEPEGNTGTNGAETAEKPKPQNTFGLVRNAARTTEGPGSPGDTKGGGNYSTSIRHALAAKLVGLAGVVYSDANGETVRECSAASVLFVKYGKDGGKDIIVFPNLKRSDILGSITMKTIWETAEAMGYNIVTQDTKNEDIDQYDECLIVGTAAGITTAHKLEIVEFAEDDDGENFRVVRTESAAEEKIANGKTASYDKANLGKPGRVAQDLNTKLCEMKRGEKPEYKHYLTEVPGTEWATKSH